MVWLTLPPTLLLGRAVTFPKLDCFNFWLYLNPIWNFGFPFSVTYPSATARRRNSANPSLVLSSSTFISDARVCTYSSSKSTYFGAGSSSSSSEELTLKNTDCAWYALSSSFTGSARSTFEMFSLLKLTYFHPLVKQLATLTAMVESRDVSTTLGTSVTAFEDSTADDTQDCADASSYRA